MSENYKRLLKRLAVQDAKKSKMLDLQPQSVVNHEFQQEMDTLDEAAFVERYGEKERPRYLLNKAARTASQANRITPQNLPNTNSFEDFLTGAAISLGDNVPQLASGLGYMATAPNDGTETPLSSWFKEGIIEQEEEKRISQLEYSDATQEAEAARLKSAQARRALFEAAGDNSGGAHGRQFIDATKEYLANPRSIIPPAAESADSFVTMPIGGAVTGAVVKQAAKKAIKEATEAQLKTASIKGAGAFGVGYTGVSEGGHTGIGAMQEVEAMPLEVLAQSPDFIKLLEDNPKMTPEEARTSLALKVGKETTAIVAPLAAAVGKVSGASDMISKSLVRGTRSKSVGGAIGATLGGASKEGVEEIAQSGGGQAIANERIQQADPTRKVSHGVADAAAAGLVAGTASGGAFSGVKETAGVVVKAAKAVPKITPKAEAPKARELEAVSTDELISTLDKAIERDDRVVLSEALGEVGTRLGTEQNPKTREVLKEQIAKVREFTAKVKSEKEAQAQDAPTAERIISTPAEELKEGDIAEGVSLITSDPEAAYSADLSQQLKGSKKLTPNQEKLVEAVSNKNSTVNKVLDKTIEDVADDILWGGEGFTGLTEYTQIISKAIQENNFDAAHRALRKLNRLNKSHSKKAATGLMQGAPISKELHAIVKDESTAINTVYQGLRDTALQAFPEFAEVEAESKKALSERISDVPKATSKTPSTTLPNTQRIKVVNEALEGVANPAVSTEDSVIRDYRKSLVSELGLNEASLKELKGHSDTFQELTKKKKLTPEERANLKESKRILLNAFDTFNAPEVLKKGTLQDLLQSHAGDRDISSIFATPESVAVSAPETKRGHTPVERITKDTSERRTKYKELHAEVAQVADQLTSEQQEEFNLLPDAFNDFSENVVENYNALAALANELEIVNSTVNAATGETQSKGTTPSNRVFKNALEKLPLKSQMRRAFKYVSPKVVGLFHTEENLFEKIHAGDEVSDFLTGEMTEATKKDAKALSKFVKMAVTSLQKGLVPEKGRDARNWINTPIEDFISADGSIDPHVANAIVLSLADWLSTSGHKTAMRNDNETIAHNLGMSGDKAKNYVPTKNEKEQLQYAGTTRAMLIQKLGKAAYTNLGYTLRTDTDDAQRHLEETLIANLGTLGVIAAELYGNVPLTETNYIHRFEFAGPYGRETKVLLQPTHAQIKDLTKLGLPKDARYTGAPTPVVRAKKRENQPEDGTTLLVSASENVIESMRNTQLTEGILGLQTSEEKIYYDGDVMPRSEDYQPYGSPQEHKGINNLNNTEYVPNDELFGFINALESEDRILLMDDLPPEGEEHIDDTERNITIRETLQAEYEGAVTVMDKLRETGSKAIRFKNNLVKTNRRINQAGTLGNVVNSKLFRELFVPKDQVVTVDPTNAKELFELKLAILRGIDGKAAILDNDGNVTQESKGIDKSVDAAVNAAWEVLLQDETMMNAAKAFSGDPSQEEVATVLKALPRKGIKAGSGGDSHVHKLHSIMALSQLLKSPDKPFEVHLGIEDDGIVNGTANLLMQLLGSSTPEEWVAAMAKVGVFIADEDSFKSFAEYTRIKGNLDPYETLAAVMTQAMNRPWEYPASEYEVLASVGTNGSLVKGASSWAKAHRKEKITTILDMEGNIGEKKRAYWSTHREEYVIRQTPLEFETMTKAVNGIINFDPTSTIATEIIEIARSFAKDPLMQYNYQAGLTGLKRALASKVKAAIKVALVEINRLDDPTDAIQLLEKYVKDLNFMEQQVWDAETRKFTETVWEFKVHKNPLETPMDFQLENSIAVAVEFSYGPALKAAFDENFAILRESTSALVNMSQLAEAVYSRMLKAEEDKILKETGQLSLSVRQERAIKEKLKQVSPKVAHAYSENTLIDGIELGEVESGVNRDESGRILNPETDKVQMEYTPRGKGKKSVSIQTVTYSKQRKDPGVSAPAMYTQATDGGIQKGDMLRNATFTNVHDAKILPIRDAAARTERTNQDFFELHRDFSFFQASVDMLKRLLNSADASTEIIEEAFEQMKTDNLALSKIPNVETFLQEIEVHNKIMQDNRKELFSLPLHIHQYFNSDKSGYTSEGTNTFENVQANWNTYKKETAPKDRVSRLQFLARYETKKGNDKIGKKLLRRRNQVAIATRSIRTIGTQATYMDKLFENEGEIQATDRIIVTPIRGLPDTEGVVALEEDSAFNELESAVEVGASFVTASAHSIISEASNKNKIGGDWAVAVYLAGQGYLPRIFHGTLIWEKQAEAVAQDLPEILTNLENQENAIYAPERLPVDYQYSAQDFSDLRLEHLSEAGLQALKESLLPNDPKTAVIDQAIERRKNLLKETAPTLSPEAQKLILQLSDQELMDKLEIAYTRAPEAPVSQGLKDEYMKRSLSNEWTQPVPNIDFDSPSKFEDLSETQVSAMELRLETEDAGHLKTYYEESVKAKAFNQSRKDSPAVIARELLATGDTRQILRILSRHFTTDKETEVLKTILRKVSSMQVNFLFINEEQLTTEELNSGQAIFYTGGNIRVLNSAIPFNDPEGVVNFYLTIVDRVAIAGGLTTAGITDTAGYKGVVSAYQRYYKTEDAPSKMQIKDFLIAARHDKTVNHRLQRKANKSILKAIKGFLRGLFGMKESTFTEYDVLMGYAAQSIFGAKHLSSETLGDISLIEKTTFRKAEYKAIQQRLLGELVRGKSLREVTTKMYQESDSQKLKAIKHVLKTIAAKEEDGVRSFSTPVSPQQYRNDESAAIEAEMEFDKTSTVEVFNSLARFTQAGTEHTSYLRDMVSRIAPAIDRLRLLVRTENITESYGSEQGNTIDLRVNTGAKANNLEMSAQEIFVHETYHAFLRAINAKKTQAWRKIEKEYKYAAKHLKVEHFLAHIKNPTVADIKAATKLRNHALFNNDAGELNYRTSLGEVKSHQNADPVEEFAVLAATNEAVKNALKNLDLSLEREKSKVTGILPRFLEAFHKLVHYFTDHIYALQGIDGDARMVKLTEHLIASQQAQQGVLYRASRSVEAGVDTVNTWIKDKFEDTNLVKGIRFGMAQYSDTVTHNLRKFVSKTEVGKSELFWGIANEFSNGRSSLAALLRLLTKSSYFIERKSQQLIEYVANEVMDILPELTKEESSSVYRGILETDAQSLLRQHSVSESLELITNAKVRKARMKALIGELYRLAPNRYATFIKHHTEDLGYHMVTGERLLADGMYTNVRQIIKLWGVDDKRKPTLSQADLFPVLDELATLHALEYSGEMDTLKALFDPSRYGVKALEALLLLQKTVVDISANEGFEGNQLNMRKGYVREKVSSDIQITTGTDADHNILLAQGFIRGEAVKTDAASHASSTRYLYTKQGGLQTYLVGVLSTATEGTVGTTLFQPTENMGEMDRIKLDIDKELTMKRKQSAMRNTQRSRGGMPRLSPEKRQGVAQPLFDSEGNIYDYRIVTSHSQKDEVLKRETDVVKALGYTLAGVSRKKETKAINEELIDYLHATYEREYKDYPEEFIELSAHSNRDRYLLIPEAAREYAETLFGSKTIYAKVSELDIAFGYRKFSVSQLRHDPTQRDTAIQEVLRLTNNLAATMFNNKVGINLETYLQSFVAMAKDTLVIKSGVVTAGNIVSNIILLWWSGVPVLQAVQDHAVAYKATFDYNRDHAEIHRISRKLSNPNVTGEEAKELAAERAVIRQRLYHNPVRTLMEAGLYQTIVDDVETSENVSEARNKIDEFLEPVVKRTPKAVSVVGKNFLMTHDTKVYQVMRDVAQISDFAARYSLHSHNMKQGMAFEASIRDVKQTFVEYDIPQHKALQYANDMGLMGFTKWLFRMQQVLIRRFGEAPARGMLVILLQNMFGGISNPVGGAMTGFDSIANRVGIDWIAASQTGAIPQLAL